MGVNKLIGTPWHVERVHREEDDNRRHKSNCKYYENGKCNKLGFRCFGSAHCDDYKEKPFKEIKSPSPGKFTVVKRTPHGSFSVNYLADNEIMDFQIGVNIKLEAELVKNVMEHEIGEIITINNEQVKIIKKDIYYV